MHRSKKNDPCIVTTTLEEPLEPPHCPWLAHFSFHFRVENLGSYSPWRSHSCFSLKNSALYERLCSLPFRVWSPWRGIHSRTAVQRFCHYEPALLLNGLKQFLELWPSPSLGAPWIVTSVLRKPRCHLLLSPGIKPAIGCIGTPSEHLSEGLPCGLSKPPLSQPCFNYFSFQERTGAGKGESSGINSYVLNLQDLAQLWGLWECPGSSETTSVAMATQTFTGSQPCLIFHRDSAFYRLSFSVLSV